MGRLVSGELRCTSYALALMEPPDTLSSELGGHRQLGGSFLGPHQPLTPRMGHAALSLGSPQEPLKTR